MKFWKVTLYSTYQVYTSQKIANNSLLKKDKFACILFIFI
jgi:hypothetical protein